jgi:ATP/ADP translocase
MDEEIKPDRTDPEMSPRDQITQLASDFRTLAAAEFDYYRARFAYSRTVAKWTGIYVAIALFALFGTIVALILGILLSLSAVIGPLLATLVVTLIFAGVTALFAALARRSSRNFSFPELGESEKDG